MIKLNDSFDFVSVSIHGVSHWAVLAGALTPIFNNGRIMILLEHVTAHSQSAAGQFVANALKTVPNYIDDKDLNW